MFDEKIFYFLNNLSGQSWLFDSLVVFLASYLQYFLGAIFLVLLLFSYSKKKQIIYFFIVLSSAVIARFGVTSIIRYFYHRPRPFLAHSVNQLIFPNGYSFPSGHASFFFALAMAIFLFNRKWGIYFFIASILISVSRVVVGVHYPSDIIGGMFVGLIVAYVIYLLTKGLVKEEL